MTSRLEAITSLKTAFEHYKRAMTAVPPHPDHQQQMPPQDPNAQQMPPQDPNAQGGGSVPPEIAAMMERVIQAVEGQAQQVNALKQEAEARISKLEQALEQERTVREERRKVIDTVLPAL